MARTMTYSLGSTIVADCAPKRVAAANKDLYQAAGVTAIRQGGEIHELSGYSFCAQVNYRRAGKQPRGPNLNVTRLRKENLELRTDTEILRRAAAYFARETIR